MTGQRIVVKVGTSSITHPNGRLHLRRIEQLVREIADAANANHEMLLVTSGAIGAGMSRLALDQRPETIPEKQAVAAVGQGLLMQIYTRMFAEYTHTCAQVLLTAEDLQQRSRYLNSRNTLEVLLKKRVIPVINENDSVATSEIQVGDNDTLSALVATLVSADLLLILSDTDGIYTRDPHQYPDAVRIPFVEEIDAALENMAGQAGRLGTGGMATKLSAARIVTRCGIPMVLASSSHPDAVSKAISGDAVGTRFVARPVKLPSRKRWLAFYTHPHGELIIDAGAAAALRLGKSLLPIGIVRSSGDFRPGDLVTIVDTSGQEIGRGLSNYASDDLAQIQGKDSTAIRSLALAHPFTEVIHRDNLVMTAD